MFLYSVRDNHGVFGTPNALDKIDETIKSNDDMINQSINDVTINNITIDDTTKDKFKIKVLPLPDRKGFENFSGAVGNFDLKAKVSKNFSHVNEKQLGQYLSVLTKFRNVCAHNERLFSYRSKDSIPNTVLHEKLNIPQKGGTYQMGKCDLFAVVIAFRYLLPAEEFISFKKSLRLQILFP